MPQSDPNELFNAIRKLVKKISTGIAQLVKHLEAARRRNQTGAGMAH